MVGLVMPELGKTENCKALQGNSRGTELVKARPDL
jgi:hypothetical protein